MAKRSKVQKVLIGLLYHKIILFKEVMREGELVDEVGDNFDV